MTTTPTPPTTPPGDSLPCLHHALKVWPQFIPALDDGSKTFEARKDDRSYQVGDVLDLYGWDPDARMETGWKQSRTVTYKLSGPAWGVEAGHCILGLSPLPAPATSPNAGEADEQRPKYDAFEVGSILVAIDKAYTAMGVPSGPDADPDARDPFEIDLAVADLVKERDEAVADAASFVRYDMGATHRQEVEAEKARGDRLAARNGALEKEIADLEFQGAETATLAELQCERQSNAALRSDLAAMGRDLANIQGMHEKQMAPLLEEIAALRAAAQKGDGGALLRKLFYARTPIGHRIDDMLIEWGMDELHREVYGFLAAAGVKGEGDKP